jgi:hypothetical protein
MLKAQTPHKYTKSNREIKDVDNKWGEKESK